MTKLKKKHKLLIVATIFIIIAISLSFALYRNRTRLLFKGLNKYVEKSEYIDNIDEYPNNISLGLKDKLATISPDTVISVYIGYKKSSFRVFPFDMTKEDILKLANSLKDISFDLKE